MPAAKSSSGSSDAHDSAMRMMAPTTIPSLMIAPHRRKATRLAFACNFMLLASYYILRPVRDTVATIVGVGQLQNLFAATFFGTLAASALYGVLASRVPLKQLIPGVFWSWTGTVVLFAVLFRLAPQGAWLGAAYYVWFSVVNLFMISVFWSLMVDIFSAVQATRVFAFIAAGGALGAIVGPLLTRLLAGRLGPAGLLLLAAAGFAAVIGLLHALMREKSRLLEQGDAVQPSTLDRPLRGSAFSGFGRLLRSGYSFSQAAFMLLMTWVNTIAYFLQTDAVARTYADFASRVQAIADIDLAVNVGSAALLLFGVGRFVRRFGVTAALVLNPLVVAAAFLATALSPSLAMIQGLQVIRRIGQYAVARPCREICFTVVNQADRYQSKNVIDTVVYRFGDLTSAWLQTGLRSSGFGFDATIALGVAASLAWSGVATTLGHRFDARAARNRPAGMAITNDRCR